MDYEKKYKESLERAKELYDFYKDNPAQAQKFVDIFPELAESEDERIKRCISDAVRKYGVEFATGTITKEKMLVWLEKQGKQKPVEEYNIIGIGSKKAQGKLGEMIKKIEENPTEIKDIENGKYYYCIKDYYSGGCKRASKGEVVQALRGMSMMALGVKANEYFIPVKSIASVRPVWSEEDKKMIEAALQFAHEYGRHGLWCWLKSLKDRVQPQPKQEWSEEDEEMLESTIKHLNESTYPAFRSYIKKDIDWLKSLRPQR